MGDDVTAMSPVEMMDELQRPKRRSGPFAPWSSRVRSGGRCRAGCGLTGKRSMPGDRFPDTSILIQAFAEGASAAPGLRCGLLTAADAGYCSA